MNENMITDQAVAAHRDYPSEILEILRKKYSPKALRDMLLDYHSNDIASVLELIGKDERKRLFSVFSAEELADILQYASEPRIYIDELNIKRKLAVLSEFEPSAAVEYLEEIEKTERQTIIELPDDEQRQEISLLLSFDDDEIGSRMTTNYIAIPECSTVKQAMNSLIKQAAENDNISTLYVVDDNEVFLGAIDLKELIIARHDTSLESIIFTSYPYVYANERIDDCIERLKDYSEDSIPVLDNTNKLVGVLISQDITQLVEDEMSDDYAKLAGLSAEEDLREPITKSIGKRLPWLIVLLGLGLLVSSVVGAFEHVVAHLSLIVCFQSLILGMAGNAGTQSLAVTIRVLMDETLTNTQRFFLIGKEARVGLINGLVLGVISFGLIGAYIMIFKNAPPFYAFSVSLCTGIALILSILLSSITGTVVPLIFKRLGIDPAVASGPLITTVNDLVAVLSYYGLAWILLINVLGL